jgi:hypothetical protein
MKWRVEVTFRGGWIKRRGPRLYQFKETWVPDELRLILNDWQRRYWPSFKWQPWRDRRYE